jgi:hypothetical protein
MESVNMDLPPGLAKNILTVIWDELQTVKRERDSLRSQLDTPTTHTFTPLVKTRVKGFPRTYNKWAARYPALMRYASPDIRVKAKKVQATKGYKSAVIFLEDNSGLGRD